MQVNRLFIYMLGVVVAITYAVGERVTFANGVPKHYSNPPPPEKKPEKPTLKITGPDNNSEFSYIPIGEGRFQIIASAKVEPPEYENQVEWELEKIGNASITVEPKRGADVVIVVEKMPEHTKDFGEKILRAFIPAEPSAKDQITIKVYFPPTATNHPGEGNGETPNWFYYWLQTSAGQGKTLAEVEYEKPCADPEVVSHFDGYHDHKEMDRFFMCDDGSWPIHSTITDQMTDGIDTFAIVVIHESEHVTMFNTWWKRIYQEMYQDSKLWNKADKKWTDIDSYFAAIEPLDGDGDRVLDSAEKGIPKSRGGPLNPEKWDTYGYKTDDQEYLAAKAQKRWTITSADHEDWSKCGKQWSKKTPKECPEIGKYIPR